MQLTSILHAFVKWNFPHNQLLFLLNKTCSNFAQQKYPVIPTFLHIKQPKLFTPTLGAWKSHMQHGMASHPLTEENTHVIQPQIFI
jgi:hypothetical protein